MKQKLYASGVHLAISIIVAIAAALLVFLVWYPSPLQKAIGVGDVFWMMLGIDVVLGPLLTFVVFKQGKKNAQVRFKCDCNFTNISPNIWFAYGIYW